MSKLKVVYADETRGILTKKELADKIASYGFRMGRSIEGQLWTGRIFVLQYQIIE